MKLGVFLIYGYDFSSAQFSGLTCLKLGSMETETKPGNIIRTVFNKQNMM